MSRKKYPLRVARPGYGIRAQNIYMKTRWWVRRWLGWLEGMRLGARLGRGRQYAFDGQVTELTREGNRVEAVVQGSRDEPYRVGVEFTACGEGSGLKERIAASPMRLARIFTQDMPMEVEAMFREEGLALLPELEMLGRDGDGKPLWDVKMSCSCPDWARPCKHLVAVLWLLGEEIAVRPQLLLGLRGVELEDEEEAFWEERKKFFIPDVGAGAGIEAREGDAAPVVRRLGAVPYWRGVEKFGEVMGKVYGRVRGEAMKGAGGKPVDLR